MLPLEGVTVVEFSNWFPGPYCARLLGDLGARVIKVEKPGQGDPERNMAGTFSVINAGKESMAVDLSTDEGREIAHRLLRRADILIENYRPGTAARLGIDYPTVSGLKGDIIYCSLTGFGQTGPLARRSAHNITVLAETGILAMGAQAGRAPADTSGVWVADLSAAMFAVVTIMGAVLQRGRDGKGAYLDISMSDCCVAWLSGVWGEYCNEAKTKEEILGYPAYGVFEAKDGKYLAIAAIVDRHWPALCKALGWSDYMQNPLFATLNGRRQAMDEINSRLAEKISAGEREYWLELLNGEGISANPVVAPGELADHSHFIQRGLLDTAAKPSPAAGVAFPALVNNERWGKERSPAPRLGQDTQDILKALAYGGREIEELVANGIVAIAG